MKKDYSIIVCTYNPDERLLTRCLTAVRNLDCTGLDIEVIIVDNNSLPAISERQATKGLLNKRNDIKILSAQRQGLIYARLEGIYAASGQCIVFFDDDNEPYASYLQELHTLRTNFPMVGAWGPGEVNVDLLGDISPKIRDFAVAIFQDRHEKHIAYACLRSAQACYPYGTGLCITEQVASEYAARVTKGHLTMVDRQGKALTSGGDMQIVFCAIALGLAAGVAPQLRITHIIPEKRLTFEYLKRLAFGTVATYDVSIKQLFSEYQINFGKPLKPNLKITLKILRRYVKTQLSANPTKTLEFASYLGLLTSSYAAAGQPPPRILNWLVKKLNLR